MKANHNDNNSAIKVNTAVSNGSKIGKTRSHTDNLGENNVKCLIAKGICRFVPHSSAGGF